ncbi:Alt-like RNA polymerase ADP-ribosyltransferase [Aeromonas phage GomatiRiver_11]|nr:hypothetical protein OBDJBBDK_00005 [Aeromonas phage AhFM11]WKW84172.1 Alt-like RNA polymerase ADP-ribosyltransferase [Aeromonas phage GomatiRiver_11]
MAILVDQVVNVEVGPISDTPWWPPAGKIKECNVQIDVATCYSKKKETTVPEIMKVEFNPLWLDLSALADHEVEKCSMVDINKSASLMDFNKARETQAGATLWETERPWMALPLGSYEQMRLIFDWEKDPANVIQTVNRIMEWRYSHSEMDSLQCHSDEVREYCDEGSEPINAYLRSGVLDDDYPIRNASILAHIEQLDKFMAESDGTSQTVYRGMKLPIADYIKFRDSGSMLFKNFVSCSLAPIMFNHGIAECRHLNLSAPIIGIVERETIAWNGQVEADRRHVKINFEITCDATPFICPGEISGYPEECEVILDRNMVFVIEELLEYGSDSKFDWPVAYVKVKAVPLAKFNGTTLVL